MDYKKGRNSPELDFKYIINRPQIGYKYTIKLKKSVNRL